MASSRPYRCAGMALALWLAGCDRGPEAGQASPEPPQGAEGRPTTVGAAPAEGPAGPARVRFDLASHLEQAELREGPVLLVDHGVPGGQKYTLGGWRTRTGDRVELDGTSALLLPGVIGKVILPIEREGAHTVRMRARAFGDGRVTVYLDEETVAHATLPSDGAWGVITLALEGVTPGERFLQLRVARVGAAPGAGRAGLAIDWIRVAPSGVEVGEGEPPAPSALVAREGDAATLRLPSGLAAGWTLQVPEGARLRGEVGRGRLRVVAHRDGAEPLALGAASAGDRLDLDLAALAGSVARLDLIADGGAVEVRSPSVVTLDAAEGPAHRTARNVLVYLIDTLRADKLSVHDPETRVRTPGLTRWARRAAVFDRGQAQENWTKPSVATLLSGLLPWEHTATTGEAVVPGSVELLSEMLQGDGFHTGAFVANGYVSDKFGFQQGFRTFRNYIREGRRTQASFVAADVLEWLDQRPEDRPFFLYVHTIDPHVPYMPPADLLREYDPGPYEGPVDFSRDRGLLEKIKVGSVRLNARDRRRLEALYDGEITYHDLHLAAILDGLERRGLADDTVVVITSDHGEEMFDHDSVGHGHSVWQELLHVPMVVRVPGLDGEQRRVGEPVGLVDVVPTVLEALGRPVPERLSGRSMLPLLRGEDQSAPRASVSGFMAGWRTLVVGHHKLIQRTESRIMLYDLASDPGETRDLAADRPLAVRWLRGMLGLSLAGELGAARGATTHRAERTTIDEETEAQLRALGYVGTSRPE